MGYYIECDGRTKGKAEWLIQNKEAIVIDEETARDWIDDPKVGVVCVVDNGPFEAAGFVYSADELRAFSSPKDHRPRKWLALHRSTAEELSGYRS